MGWQEHKSSAPFNFKQASGELPKVSILMPHTSAWDAEFVERMWKPLTTQRQNDWCIKNTLLCRVPTLPMARNTLVQELLKGDSEYALWVDSDMTPESPENPNEAASTLLNLIRDTGEHIVTGLYRAKQAHGFNYAIWKRVENEDGKEGFVHINEWTGNWFEVDVCGLGFCMMSRKVLRDMWQASQEWGGMPFHWETPDTRSEDFAFLMRAKSLGYKVWCFSDVKLTHLGRLAITSDGGLRVPMV